MTATATNPLTAKQTKILRFIVSYWGKHMAPPSIREIGAEFGMMSPNGVVTHLKALAKKSAIIWQGHEGDTSRSRGIVVPALLDAAGKAAREYLKQLGGGK